MSNVTVADKAKRIADLAFGEGSFGNVVDAIIQAILSERNHCADVATKEGNGYRNNSLPLCAMGAYQVHKPILAGETP